MSDRDDAVRELARVFRNHDPTSDDGIEFLKRCTFVLDEFGIEEGRVDLVIEAYRLQIEQEVETTVQLLEDSLRAYEAF